MERNSRIGLGILLLAASLGVAGDVLLRDGPIGIGGFLATVALAVGFALLIQRLELPLRGAGYWIGGAVPLLALVLVWRASPPLILLTIFSITVGLVAAAMSAHRRPLESSGAWDLGVSWIATAAHAWLGIVPLVGKVQWGQIGWRPWNSTSGAVLRGAALAVPPLVVFAALFMSADAAFATHLTNLVRVDLELVMSHVVLAAVLTWLAAGYLFWVVLGDSSRVPRGESLGVRLGMLEVLIVLGSIILLFIAFIAVQSTYLFGGEEMVQATTGLTYAEYARSGFFEMAVAAGLVLPLLLFGIWAVRDEPTRRQRMIRGSAMLLVVLVFVIMGSAMLRMQLYQSAYGLTLPRIYATALIVWLAVVFTWFIATVLRGRARRFVAGAVVTAMAGVLLLAAMNPEARVVDANAERARSGASFDAAYAMRELGPDAVPALVAALPTVPAQDACVVAHHLVQEWGSGSREAQMESWRSWNLARARARDAVRENEATLRGLACAPAPRPG